jgi:hypothetical protein
MALSTYQKMLMGPTLLPTVLKTTVENRSIVQWQFHYAIDLREAQVNPNVYNWIPPLAEAGVGFDQALNESPSSLGIFGRVSPFQQQQMAIPQAQLPSRAVDTYTYSPRLNRIVMNLWENDQEKQWILLAVVPIPDLWQMKQELDRQQIPYQFGRGFKKVAVQAGIVEQWPTRSRVGVYISESDL